MQRQRYVSNELTHFVGRSSLHDLNAQFEMLLKILKMGWLTHEPHDPKMPRSLATNPTGSICENNLLTEQFVCFCDIPIDDLLIHSTKYGSFGLSFGKEFLVDRGASPVFYIARGSMTRAPVDLSDPNNLERALVELATSPRREVLSKTDRCSHFNEMVSTSLRFFRELEEDLYKEWIAEAERTRKSPSEVSPPPKLDELARLRRFLLFDVFSFIKFFDHARADDDQENYYMEREWRVADNVQFRVDDIAHVFMPQSFEVRFCREYPGLSRFVFIDT